MRKIILIISSTLLILAITDNLLKRFNNVYLNFREANKGYGSVPTSDIITNPELKYYFYIPAVKPPKNGFPVMIVPGWGALPPWSDFAAQNNFVIISPYFVLSEKDFDEEKSFHYPAAWSGNALIAILDDLKGKTKLDRNGLYLYGFSAGAQFAHRFALLHPEMCRAVAAIAPGGITFPETYVPVSFYLSVGKEDKVRIEGIREFYVECTKLGINAIYEVIEGQGHMVSESQTSKAFKLFLEKQKYRN